MSGFGGKGFGFQKKAANNEENNDSSTPPVAAAPAKRFTFGRDQNSTGGFTFSSGNAAAPTQQGSPAKKKERQEAQAATTIPEVSPIVYDIADGTKLLFELLNDTTTTTTTTRNTLRFTNNKSGLTLMPAIQLLPEHIQHVEFDADSCNRITTFDSLRSEGDGKAGFLRCSPGLQSVNLSCLTNVLDFGDYFLQGCKNLQSVEFPPSASPGGNDEKESKQKEKDVHIGRCFLFRSPVKEVDLSYFSTLREIPYGFMAENPAIEDVILPPFSKLARIENAFFHHCKRLKRVTFRAVDGDRSDDRVTTSVDDGNEPTLFTSIGDRAFKNCCALETLDLSPLFENRRIAKPFVIGNEFCRKCDSLQTLILPQTVPIAIGNHFLGYCASLLHVNLSFFKDNGLTELPSNFLHECGSLANIDVAPLKDIICVGPAAFAMCTKLEALDLTTWTKLWTIKNCFATGCETLSTLQFPSYRYSVANGGDVVDDDGELSPPVQGFNVDGTSFLGGCKSLETLDLSGCNPNTTTIPDSFLDGCASLKHLDLTPFANVTTIRNNVFRDCDGLLELHLPFTSVLSFIGDYFCAGCGSLEKVTASSSSTQTATTSTTTTVDTNFFMSCKQLHSIDLSFLHHLQHIPDGFLSHCQALTELDTSPLSHVTSIGDFFLGGCTSLEAVDTSSMKVTSLGHSFLVGCASLKTVDLGGCTSALTAVPNRFCLGCSGLELVDLSPLSNATSIGDDFFRECDTLQAVHLPFQAALTSIGDGFFYECESLQIVTIEPALTEAKSVTTVGHAFFRNCVALREVDITFLSNVTSIGMSCFRNCASLKRLDTTPLTQVTSIGECFATECKSLEELDIGLFHNLSTVGAGTLYKCDALKTIHNAHIGFANVVEFKPSVLFSCKALEHIDLSGASNVQRVSEFFMAECCAIKSVDLSSWTQLQHIGEGFLGRATQLSQLTFPSSVPSGLVVDKFFLGECFSLASLDLRFLSSAKLGISPLVGCSPSKLHVILAPTSLLLPYELTSSIIRCDENDTGGGGGGVSQLQWSWKHHVHHPNGVQLAVMWLFGGLQYQHTTAGREKVADEEGNNDGDDPRRCLPGEVAYEICRFIGTATAELFGGPGLTKRLFPGFGGSKRSSGHSGGKAFKFGASSASTPFTFKKI